MDLTIRVEMRVQGFDHISELLVGIGGATYEIRIPFERALDPAELHQIRLDIDRAYLPANAKVERIWQQSPTRSAKPVVRKWNLNEAKGRCAGTNIVESVMELHLGLKRKDGRQESVGRYHLDLDALADAGFVSRRVVEGNRVFDVQIYRESDGSYSLGVRQDHTTPLAPFAIP
jgi:hypothetical protein